MRKGNIITATLALALIGTPVVQAKTSLWEVSKGDSRLYLGGTIHVLGKQDYPLPCEYQLAYDNSEKVVFETDFSVIESQAFSQKIFQAGLYPVGQSLGNKLSPETLQELVSYIESLGLPVQNMLQFKPGMLMSVLTMTELQKLGVTSAGVDQYYSKLSVADEKVLGALETPQQQIDFIMSLGEGNEEKFIQYLIDSVSDLEKTFSELKLAWRNGDLDRLSLLSEIDKIRSDFPSIFNTLLAHRNNDWMPKIQTMLETPEVEYVLVGALHLVGDVGLLTQLENKGFSLKQLSGCDTILRK